MSYILFLYVFSKKVAKDWANKSSLNLKAEIYSLIVNKKNGEVCRLTVWERLLFTVLKSTE